MSLNSNLLNSNSIILASMSKSRLKLLQNVGINITAMAPKMDEEEVKDKLLEQGIQFQALAEALAVEKALQISLENPDHFVIGGDQILLCGEHMFSKADDLKDAREHLRFFRGQEHYLITAVALLKNGKTIWHHTDIPELTMRGFSDEYLEEYLKINGQAIKSSVGCYFLEEQGLQLFDKIEGDYFSILGLPLLPLLHQLRSLKVLKT